MIGALLKYAKIGPEYIADMFGAPLRQEDDDFLQESESRASLHSAIEWAISAVLKRQRMPAPDQRLIERAAKSVLIYGLAERDHALEIIGPADCNNYTCNSPYRELNSLRRLAGLRGERPFRFLVCTDDGPLRLAHSAHAIDYAEAGRGSFLDLQFLGQELADRAGQALITIHLITCSTDALQVLKRQPYG